MLFLLVLCSFNFYFKIMWPSPTKLPPSSPQQYTPHQNKNFYPLPPKLEEGVHALFLGCVGAQKIMFRGGFLV